MPDATFRTPAVGAAAYELDAAEPSYSEYSSLGTTEEHLDELQTEVTSARASMQTAVNSETSVQDQLEDRLSVDDDGLELDDGLEP